MEDGVGDLVSGDQPAIGVHCRQGAARLVLAAAGDAMDAVRALVDHVYWYRFTDSDGNGSRVGRTITAPTKNDPRTVKFAFVSCQGTNEGKMNGYRRMIFEDERARPEDQLNFVLHLGDFIYEVVQYPEDGKPRFDRKVYEVARIPDALKVSIFHIPTTVEGYRAVWKGHLADPDLQDARARWPFVCTCP